MRTDGLSLVSRRDALASLAGALSVAWWSQAFAGKADASFQLKYIVGSCMYGYLDLETIVKQVPLTGAAAIDIWPKVHGNQREQLDEMGEEKFAALLERHSIRLGCLTQYKLGPFGLQDEMHLAKRFGCQTIVTGGKGPKDAVGAELKAAVATFVEHRKPQLAICEETGVATAIENHANNLVNTPDSL